MHFSWRPTIAAFAAALLMACAGCGQKVKSVPVSGRVTLRGQPLADVALNFSPLTGNEQAYAAYGKTDSDGRYTLRLVDNDQPGATAGQNRVTLNESTGAPENDGGGPAVTFKLPFKARDGTMTFEVPAEGTDKADFAF
jgi:hypothetical protein